MCTLIRIHYEVFDFRLRSYDSCKLSFFSDVKNITCITFGCLSMLRIYPGRCVLVQIHYGGNQEGLYDSEVLAPRSSNQTLEPVMNFAVISVERRRDIRRKLIFKRIDYRTGRMIFRILKRSCSLTCIEQKHTQSCERVWYFMRNAYCCFRLTVDSRQQ